jgi:hypothetical protein
MAIEVMLGEAKPQDKSSFPKFMKHYQTEYPLVVFMIREQIGVIVIASSRSSPVGTFADDFVMDEFFDYNEPITLKNK